ncbi:DUF4838 domain-containing protein [Polaribacter sp. R77954]|uniref:DUF4838 domain-containing protein n=1 Tax=Polaribacter sp. R77954 TaxID=3093870 RepID=UPI0037CC6164
MMFKKYIYLIITFLSLTTCAQTKVILFSKKEKITPKINIPLSADQLVTEAATDFRNKFKAATGETLKIERSNGLNKNYSYVLLRVNPTQKENFCIYRKSGNITIQGSSTQNLIYGISDFFQHYTSLNYISGNNTSPNFDTEIKVPVRFSRCESPNFGYREPYYSPNFNPDFRAWNKTNYLELEWGIWGHNLPKILKEYKLPESVYAKLGDKRVKSQFCFTSADLFNYVNKRVKEIYDSDHALNKYMILPNDNNIVCTCNTCKAIGNTTKNAAPAVFDFLNKLAKNNKKSSFFTAAYVTVKNVPKFDAETNTGIFYSTIDIQKGIPIEDTKDFKQFDSDIKKWKTYLNNVYIWDYTVNFDNYFDIYPILKTTQKNLKLYKKLGVNGVFLHGSEYDFSTFQNCKTTIFAKLLWNVDINIDNEIALYFSNRYSKKLASLLTNYFTFINETFLISNKELSIYSGIDETVKKYLDPKVFFDFYNEFDMHTENNKFNQEYLKLATALTFLKLEIMRDYGLGIYGYGTLNGERQIIVKNEITTLLDNLTNYSRSAGIKTYNERKYKIEDYIESWRKSIYKHHKRKHYFYKKKFEVLSQLDEDYTNTQALNDGAFGLQDYNTNWHISSVDDLVLKIDKKGIAKSEKITFSFLQDTKHNIYYPSTIEILDTNYKVIKAIEIQPSQKLLDTKETSIELPKKLDDIQLPDSFIIKIKKHSTTGKNAMACDEIIFN